jgi:chromosome segregation ATPase
MANYLGRNVNLALLVIIIGVIVALVGTTVFFQRGLQNRTQEFETTAEGLNSCQTALANYQTKYTQAELRANETSADIRKYDQLYEQKTGELKDAQGQLSEMTRQRDFEKLQKEKFRTYYEDASRQNAQLNATVVSLNKDLANWKDKYDDLKDDYNALKASC